MTEISPTQSKISRVNFDQDADPYTTLDPKMTPGLPPDPEVPHNLGGFPPKVGAPWKWVLDVCAVLLMSALAFLCGFFN